MVLYLSSVQYNAQEIVTTLAFVLLMIIMNIISFSQSLTGLEPLSNPEFQTTVSFKLAKLGTKWVGAKQIPSSPTTRLQFRKLGQMYSQNPVTSDQQPHLQIHCVT